jgi:hypothetical protein
MDRELEGLSPGQVKALMAAARDAQATGDVGYWERTLLRPVMHQQLKQVCKWGDVIGHKTEVSLPTSVDSSSISKG